MYSYRL